MALFMFCRHCIPSMHVPTKFECLESIRNKFMPLDEKMFVAKLKYLQRGSGCCKKRRKKLTNLISCKPPPSDFLLSLKEGILIRNYLRNPIKMVLMLYIIDFLHRLEVYNVEKVNEEEIVIFCPHFQY